MALRSRAARTLGPKGAGAIHRVVDLRIHRVFDLRIHRVSDLRSGTDLRVPRVFAKRKL